MNVDYVHRQIIYVHVVVHTVHASFVISLLHEVHTFVR